MEPSKTEYSEKQRFRQWWIWIFVGASPAVFLWLLLQQMISGSPVGDNDFSDPILVIAGLIFGVGFPVFMYTTGLDTEVCEDGACIRFRPFHRKWVVFEFQDIRTAEALTYSPLMDYGGWGIRFGRGAKAYNVSGNKGVLLTLENGKTVLIGSQNHEMLNSVINTRLS